MTPEGYRNRIACLEWHAQLWLTSGVERERCVRLIDRGTECIEADFYGIARGIYCDDPEIARMIVYLDEVFASRQDRCLVSFA